MKVKKEISEFSLVCKEIEEANSELNALVVKTYDELPAGVIKAEDRYGNNIEEARKLERRIKKLVERLNVINEEIMNKNII